MAIRLRFPLSDISLNLVALELVSRNRNGHWNYFSSLRFQGPPSRLCPLEFELFSDTAKLLQNVFMIVRKIPQVDQILPGLVPVVLFAKPTGRFWSEQRYDKEQHTRNQLEADWDKPLSWSWRVHSSVYDIVNPKPLIDTKTVRLAKPHLPLRIKSTDQHASTLTQ